MFNSRRRSRPTETKNGLLPQTNPGNVNSNALAAASAIGNALKTGTPIPRSNSLQRTASISRSSYIVPNGSRAGSLIGLQTAPSQFQENPQNYPRRSQSFTTGPKPRQVRPNSSFESLPRMVKKHVPGPYGLITIEVPAEEAEPRQQSITKSTVRRSSSIQRITRPPKVTTSGNDSGSVRSLNSSNSKRPINENLKEIGEDEPLNFERVDHFKEFEAPLNPDLTSIQEEDKPEAAVEAEAEKLSLVTPKDNFSKADELDSDLNDLKISKNIEEAEFEKDINLKEHEKQLELNENRHDYTEKNPYLDEDSDEVPSTSKSSETFTPAQSSYTTEGSEQDIRSNNLSMAQQLRSTIPTLLVQQESPTSTEPSGLAPTSSYEEETGNSSLLSGDPTSEEKTGDEEGSIPARSDKRSVVPMKSALKIKSTSSINLPDGKNPANAAYLSLTTAENTRLNALSTASPVTSSPRPRSVRNSVQPQPNGIRRTHLPQGQTLLKPPLLSQNNNSPQQKYNTHNQIPASTIEPSSSTTRRSPQRPQSAQGFRSTHIQQPQLQQSQPRRTNTLNSKPNPYHPQKQGPVANQNNVYKSASNAAAVNATIKKIEPPKPERSSSFERERTGESSSAFKRKSLRDPSFNTHHNPESNLGFYRHQAQQQQRQTQQAPHHHQQQHQQQHSPQQHRGIASSGFNSRFNDSDSDLDVPIGGSDHQAAFAPPKPHSNGHTLRKPKSHFTLRSPSASAIPENSPAKSLPEKRATRFFSESDKEHIFDQQKKTEPAKEEKKKGTFGKLKKLFGRSK